MNPKLMLLLFGALMLVGATCGKENSPPSSLSNADKRRIIRKMLDAQKDIKNALLKIRRQIQGDLNSTGHNGAAGDDSDEDDIDEEMGGDGFGDISGEEEKEYFKEQQKKIYEAREKLEISLKNIVSSLIAIKEYVENIDHKVNEAIRSSGNKDYSFYYYSKPGQQQQQGLGQISSLSADGSQVKPPGIVTGSWSYTDPSGLDLIELYRCEDAMLQTIAGTGSGKGKPVGTRQLSCPDFPGLFAYEGPVEKAVEFQRNQQQVE